MNKVVFLGAGGGRLDIPSDKPSLETLQKAVGGYIERVPDWDKFEGESCIAYCNEEGLLHNLPRNLNATQLWREHLGTKGPFHLDRATIVGDVIILVGDRRFLR